MEEAILAPGRLDDRVPSAGGQRCPCCGAVVPPRLDRPFALTDAMFLIAASAVAFLLVRPIINTTLKGQPNWASWLAAVLGVLVTWTPTVLFLNYRGPRPELRRLTRRPGFVAGVAGTVIISLGLLSLAPLSLIRIARRGALLRAGLPVGPPDPSWWMGVALHFGAVVGPAVIGAWAILALSGRRRPSAGFLDVMGRAIGAVWIVLFVIQTTVRLAELGR